MPFGETWRVENGGSYFRLFAMLYHKLLFNLIGLSMLVTKEGFYEAYETGVDYSGKC